jgi:hypothetical protein
MEAKGTRASGKRPKKSGDSEQTSSSAVAADI